MKTTEENNRMIAEFMSGQKVSVHHNQYHVSWNELMPVVSKCRTLSNADNELWEAVYYSLEEIDIMKTYQVVVKFIEWYNEQNK